MPTHLHPTHPHPAIVPPHPTSSHLIGIASPIATASHLIATASHHYPTASPPHRDPITQAKKGGLTTLETVVAVHPLVEEWSTANGCLTATQKLVPKAVTKFNKAEFDVIKKKGIK